jgi:hypothetical protein
MTRTALVLALAGAAALACASRQPSGAGARAARNLLDATSVAMPRPGAVDVCPDTNLRLTFRGPVAVGQAGAIRVFAATAPAAPIATVDVAVAGNRRMLAVDEPAHEVTIVLPPRALVAGGSAFVTVDDGVFFDDGGRSLGAVTGDGAWRFSTRAARPAAAGTLTVAADGSGEFCTVQGAVDAVPGGSTAPVTIAIKNGRYREAVRIAGKQNLRLAGEDRRKTVITGASPAVLRIENASDVTVENLTLHNLTPEGGGPAAALRVDPGERVIVRRTDLISRQGTLLLTGRVYLNDCYVEGNVDLVSGLGIAFFERCELKTVGRAGHVVNARNPPNRLGYVFYDSMFTADAGIIGSFLARVDAIQYPASQVAFLFCMLGPHLDPAGWLVTPADAFTGELRLWEYDNRGLATPFLNRAGRHPAARLLTAAAADRLRNKVNVLGGWNPGTASASKGEQ